MYHRACDVAEYIREVRDGGLLQSELERIRSLMVGLTVFPMENKENQNNAVAQANQIFKALLLEVHQTQDNEEKHKRVNKQTIPRRASAFRDLEQSGGGTQDRTQERHQQGVNNGVSDGVADNVEQQRREESVLRALHQDGGDHLPTNENKIHHVFEQLSLSSEELIEEPSPRPRDDCWQDERYPEIVLRIGESQHTTGMADVI